MALIQKRLPTPYFDTGRLVPVPDFELVVDQALYVLPAETIERRKPEVTLFRDWLLEHYGQP